MENITFPTPEQEAKTEELRKIGYTWDKNKSTAACGVVLTKGDDLYFFGLSGEILHNPDGITIKV